MSHGHRLTGPLGQVYPELFGDRPMRTLTPAEHNRWNDVARQLAIQLGTWPVSIARKRAGHRGLRRGSLGTRVG